MKNLQAMFLGIATAAPVGVLAVNRGGCIHFANPALCEIFGYTPHALAGLPVETLLPDAMQTGHQKLRDGFFANPSARGMGQGRPLFGRHADGRLLPVEIGLGAIGEGEEALAIAFVNNLSHKQHAQAQFAAIISALPAGLLLADARGRILLTNPALDDMFGYPADALSGQPVEVLLPLRSRSAHPDLRTAYTRAPDKRAMGAGRDLMALHSSGKEFPVEIALTPLLHQEQLGTLAIVTDISVRKKLEHALRQSNANLEEFTYIAAHDLRSPLHGIADLISWIEEDLDPALITETIAHNFKRARQRIARTEQMVEDLLTYAQSNTRETRTEPLNPRRLIQEIIEQANAPPGFTIEVEAPDESFVTAKTPLQAGLRNLLQNALKHHGGAAGRVKITAREHGRFMIFSVSDDGPGVPVFAREKIFKLFHRGAASQGHGIGLSVTRRMVAAHGGELVLEPECEQGGACFAIYWPRFELKDDG